MTVWRIKITSQKEISTSMPSVEDTETKIVTPEFILVHGTSPSLTVPTEWIQSVLKENHGLEIFLNFIDLTSETYGEKFYAHGETYESVNRIQPGDITSDKKTAGGLIEFIVETSFVWVRE